MKPSSPTTQEAARARFEHGEVVAHLFDRMGVVVDPAVVPGRRGVAQPRIADIVVLTGSEKLTRSAREAEMVVVHKVKVGRAYDEPARGDGARVLVDRIWPRGLSKDKAHLDEWCKAVAPSTALRKWYQHDPERFEEFRGRYRTELEEPERADALAHLRTIARRRNLTLLTAAKRADISEATVLAELLR